MDETELEKAAKKLVAKLDELSPALTSAFAFLETHHFKWTSGNYANELEELRNAIEKS